MPISTIPTKRSSTSPVGLCAGAILLGESMDPLEKFKADFARLRGEAHQPKAEKANDKPRPWRKQNKQTQTNGQDGKQPEPRKVYWHGEVDFRESRPQLVQDVIPKVGHGL